MKLCKIVKSLLCKMGWHCYEYRYSGHAYIYRCTCGRRGTNDKNPPKIERLVFDAVNKISNEKAIVDMWNKINELIDRHNEVL